MKKITSILHIAALAACAAAGSAHADTDSNLVANGSFEANRISSAWAQLSAVKGWTSSVSGATAFEIQRGATQGGLSGFNPVAADGKQYLELNTEQFTSVSQAIATSQNSLYTLSFNYSGRPDTASHAQSAMNVYWGGQLLTATALIGNTNGVWQTYTVDNLVGQQSSTTLKFQSVGPTTARTYGSYLDNVSVTSAVPEAQTYAMMLLGLGLVGFTVRRKRGA